jgi:hypothetical protein
VINLNPSQTERAFALMGWLPGLWAYDCFSLALAETTESAMLLTGDQQLRSAAARLGVEVHGVLWISDEIERSSKMSFADLAAALARLEADPLVFLSRRDVRIKSARKGRLAASRRAYKGWNRFGPPAQQAYALDVLKQNIAQALFVALP